VAHYLSRVYFPDGNRHVDEYCHSEPMPDAVAVILKYLQKGFDKHRADSQE